MSALKCNISYTEMCEAAGLCCIRLVQILTKNDAFINYPILLKVGYPTPSPCSLNPLLPFLHIPHSLPALPLVNCVQI